MRENTCFSYSKRSSTQILKKLKSMLVEAEGLCLSKAKDQWLRLHQHRQGSQRAFQEKRETQVPQAPRAPREGGQTLVS